MVTPKTKVDKDQYVKLIDRLSSLEATFKAKLEHVVESITTISNKVDRSMENMADKVDKEDLKEQKIRIDANEEKVQKINILLARWSTALTIGIFFLDWLKDKIFK